MRTFEKNQKKYPSSERMDLLAMPKQEFNASDFF